MRQNETIQTNRIKFFCSNITSLSHASAGACSGYGQSQGGCIYNKNTGAKILSPSIIRIWSKTGNGGSSGSTDGCYSGIQLANEGAEWDFIEVIVREHGRFYTQQYKLPPNALDTGMTNLGLPDDVARYDFYLDIID